MSREKLQYAQNLCVRSAGKAIQTCDMIGPGAKVGIAVSGGMDSFVLLKVMQIRQTIVPFPFEMMALHVNPGFDKTSHYPLLEWLEKNNIKGHVEVTDHGPRAHTPENRTNSPCFFCARLRRKRLFELCQEYGLTHLAFGHNADDLVSTFLLNLVQTGRVDGMSMSDMFFGGVLKVIRPLLMVEKPYIAKAVKQWDLPLWDNPCPSAGITKRTELLEKLDIFCGDSNICQRNIYNGLIRWQWAKNKVVDTRKSKKSKKELDKIEIELDENCTE